MKLILQIFIPIVLIGGAAFVYKYLVDTAAPPRQRPNFATTPEVVARPLKGESYPITLESQGTVRARTTSTLIPEVRGRIVNISPNFREGAFFEEGDVLLEIDASDYETELVVAEAAYAQAELRLLEEQARYDQAKTDWEKINPGEEANSLTLREPQIRQAKASAASARARVENAQRNLERTNIRAPFAGRVLSKNVDVGQYISPGNQLARIYAVDFAEVRLPLTASQFAFLNLPSVYRGENPTFQEGPLVSLTSTVGGETHTWRGRIVRAEGSVDTRTRQYFVVAQVRNPYGRTEDGRPPLKVGSFVTAEIQGKTLEDVYVIPRKLLRENVFVLLVDKENYLARRRVSIAWQTDDVIVVDKGLAPGDRLCLTEVPYALEGWPVNAKDETGDILLAEAPDEDEEPRARPPRPPAGGPGGSIGDRIDGIITAAGESLPEDLKAKLLGVKESGDFAQMRPIMGEVREWAEANGVELPARGGGRRPGGGGGGGARGF
ncbi:MAG: efflux RND transporter periplasmic adaptor subunit [Verrucomicrobiota bacterium]